MRSGFFFVREAAPSQLTPSDHTGKRENPERGVAELQTGVGAVLRNKGIWLSNREDVVVGHYTPDATAKNESTAPAESRRGILFGVVKVSADDVDGTATLPPKSRSCFAQFAFDASGPS